MRGDHIIKMLEETSVGRLSESEIALIGSHTAECSDCLKAYETARISAVMVKARTREIVEPSPFFETRVMATLRERHLSPTINTFLNLWKAASALVSTMAAVIVILIALSFYVDGSPQDEEVDMSAIQAAFSPETVLLDPTEPTEESLPYDQVLTTMYDVGDADGQ
jgi:hypothetical protein